MKNKSLTQKIFLLALSLLSTGSLFGKTLAVEPTGFHMSAMSEVRHSFKHSFSHLNQQGADDHLITQSGIKKYSEWQNPPITYYGPSANNQEGKLTYKYSFEGTVKKAAIKLRLWAWNWGKSTFGEGSAWVSKDGANWVKILTRENPISGGKTSTFNELLPNEVLGSNELFLQIRLKVYNSSVGSYTNSQFGRADSNSNDDIFSIEVEYANIVCVDVPVPYPKADPPKENFDFNDDLIAWYPFDGNASDISGNDFHGTISGTQPSLDRYGKAKKAFFFDGQDDYIDIPNFAWTNRENCSISLWSKYDLLPKDLGKDYGMIFGMNSEAHCLFLHQDKLFFRQGWGNGWFDFPSTDEWHHFVLQWDGAEKTVAFYSDSKLINQHKGYQKVGLGKGSLRFGANDRLMNYHFKGSIDDVRIYDRALSEEEVLALYELESTNPNEDRPTPPPAPGTGGLTPPDPDYKDTIAELKRLLAEKDKKLAHCETEMTAKEKQIGELTSEKAKLQGEVKSLNGKVTELETEVTALKTDNKGLKGQIQNLREDNQNISYELTTTTEHLEEAIKVAETPFINGWVYDPARGWIFTDAEHFPLVYTHNDQSWNYYELGSSDPRYFYNYTTQEWVAWDAQPEETEQTVASNSNF